MLSVSVIDFKGVVKALEFIKSKAGFKRGMKINIPGVNGSSIAVPAMTFEAVNDIISITDKFFANSFLEHINITFDLKAPLYFWNALGVKVNIPPANFLKHLSVENFVTDDVTEDSFKMLKANIAVINKEIDSFAQTRSRDDLMKIYRSLPASFMFTERITMNYREVIETINEYENHSLIEWSELIKFFKGLPYMNVFLEWIRGLKE